MTEFDERDKKLLEQYGGTALPFAVLIGASGEIRETFSGMFSAGTLVEAIRRSQ
jgi:thiol:disulfide interchange protein